MSLNKPMPPSTFLRMTMQDAGVNQSELAEAIGVNRASISRILGGKSQISKDMAARFGKLFGGGPNVWLNIQAKYDAWCVTNGSDKVDLSFIRPRSPVKRQNNQY